MTAKLLSSLPLQIMLLVERNYNPIFFVLTVLTYMYKAIFFTIPTVDLGMEVFAIFAVGLVQWARVKLAMRGNKMEQAGPLTVGVVLGILTAFIHVYFLLWQNYVYVIDVALNGTALGLFVIEFALAVPTLVAFSRPV